MKVNYMFLFGNERQRNVLLFEFESLLLLLEEELCLGGVMSQIELNGFE
jgi:hypothetical protein